MATNLFARDELFFSTHSLSPQETQLNSDMAAQLTSNFKTFADTLAQPTWWQDLTVSKRNTLLTALPTQERAAVTAIVCQLRNVVTLTENTINMWPAAADNHLAYTSNNALDLDENRNLVLPPQTCLRLLDAGFFLSANNIVLSLVFTLASDATQEYRLFAPALSSMRSFALSLLPGHILKINCDDTNYMLLMPPSEAGRYSISLSLNNLHSLLPSFSIFCFDKKIFEAPLLITEQAYAFEGPLLLWNDHTSAPLTIHEFSLATDCFADLQEYLFYKNLLLSLLLDNQLLEVAPLVRQQTLLSLSTNETYTLDNTNNLSHLTCTLTLENLFDSAPQFISFGNLKINYENSGVLSCSYNNEQPRFLLCVPNSQNPKQFKLEFSLQTRLNSVFTTFLCATSAPAFGKIIFKNNLKPSFATDICVKNTQNTAVLNIVKIVLYP